MGTVGLSFGSPTSGAGFDVSSTVASIVSNLQKVETPWKNQLSALESQDTALSSLGTLFSSLSNDLSSLTDLTGILAEKTGSSSDTNVLTLTAANSSAVAGTHTVEVQSLATTSSGYLTEIANASDALSGSITLQVGAGSAQTIAVPTGTGSNNLAGLASAINASGVGVTASVLTDASGSRLSLVSGTSGAAGNIAVTANSITDTATSTALAYTSPVSGVNAQLTVDGVSLTSASNTVANLIPGVTFQLLAPSATESGGSLEQIQVVIGNDNTGVESTVNQFVSDYNALIAAINAQEGDTSSGTPEPLFGSPTLSLLQQQLLSGLNTANPSGYLTAVTDSLNPTLSGSITLKVGNSIPESFTVGNSDNTLAGLASAINAANMGVTASVVQNSDGTSNLTFLSQAAGSAGALSVTSSLAAASATPLTFSGTDATASTAATGTLSSIPRANDVLSGSLSIQVGSGSSHTIPLNSSDNTLAGLEQAINSANLGVTASIVTNPDNSSSLSLVSNLTGQAGNLTVSSNLLDTTSTTSANLAYTSSSDIGSLTSLGIGVNNDGSLTFDPASLDSVLNSDYSSVVGFFQNANGWGQSFATMLTNAGSSSPTGVLALASSSNSNVESTLNADISRENSLISAQQSSLTTELNSANEIMQQLPTELQGVNELYSAITGYNQNLNG